MGGIYGIYGIYIPPYEGWGGGVFMVFNLHTIPLV